MACKEEGRERSIYERRAEHEADRRLESKKEKSHMACHEEEEHGGEKAQWRFKVKERKKPVRSRL